MGPLGRFLLLVGVSAGASACGLLDKEKAGRPAHAVEGSYWWAGTRVIYSDNDIWGPLSRLTGTLVHGTTATLTAKDSYYVLTLPECVDGVILNAAGAGGRAFTANNVDCAVTEAAKAFGYKSWRIPTLRIDLDTHAMYYRLCVADVNDVTDCGQDTAVFAPMGGGEVGGAGGGDGTSELANFADSVQAWRLDNEQSKSLQCAELAPSGVECAADPNLQRIRTQGRDGTVHRMKDGRYYLAGYDCYVPSPYDGEPIRCGQSFDGMGDVGIPTAWIYKFSLSGVDLHFEAEMRGKDYKYYLIVDGPVVPL